MQLVEFEVDAAAAVARFEAYQAIACRGFQARDLLLPSQLRAAYLPFWAFSCSVTSEYKATLGFKDAG